MTRGAAAIAFLAIATILAGCTPRLGASRPWDAYANEGRLRVYGAPRDAAGPRVYRALASRRELRGVLDPDREPDTLEVTRRRGGDTHIVLTYSRRSAGRPRRIVLESRDDRVVAAAPQPLRRGARTASRRESPAADDVDEATMTGASAAPSGEPTRTQALECPIDRQRADCRAYCDAGANYEWCR